LAGEAAHGKLQQHHMTAVAVVVPHEHTILSHDGWSVTVGRRIKLLHIKIIL